MTMSPMTRDESLIDMAMRRESRTQQQRDEALTAYRIALLRAPMRSALLERTADLILGESA